MISYISMWFLMFCICCGILSSLVANYPMKVKVIGFKKSDNLREGIFLNWGLQLISGVKSLLSTADR